jgi:hypothetical protein
MRISVLTIMFAAFAGMFFCGSAFAKEYAEDPVAAYLKDKSGDVWDKVKAAHEADWKAETIDALSALAEKETYAPEAALTVLMMACNGNAAAEEYILKEAEGEGALAGALSEMGCVFLDCKKSIPALIARMGETGGNADYFRGVAGTALAALTGVYIEPDMKRWQDWWDANKEKFTPDNKADLERYIYEIRNGLFTSRWVFKEVGADTRFMELLAEYNKTAKKFSGERWAFGEATAAMGRGEFDKAREIAEAALKDYPNELYAMYIVACAALQTGDAKGARERFEAITALNSEIRSAKFLADYCRELLAGGKEPGEIPILMKLFRALPSDETGRGWDVPEAYIFSKAFDRGQEEIRKFAARNADKPDILAGALMMMADSAARLELAKAAAAENPNDGLLRMLRLQFLARSGIKQNLADVQAELDAITRLDADNALPDCLRIYMGMDDVGMSDYLGGAMAPLAEEQLQALIKAAGKRRLTALTGRKQEALLAASRAMGGPMWHARALNAAADFAASEPQWILNTMAAKTASNIAEAVQAGDTEKAREIYKALESIATKVASEDNSLANASLARIIMNHADSGMARGYMAAGNEAEADKYQERITRRATETGISTVQVDPYRWLRKLPVPKIADALSALMLKDERGFYKKYPDPATVEKPEE